MPQHDVGLTYDNSRLSLIKGLKQQHYAGGIVISTQQLHEEKILKDNGATMILLPFYNAAERAVERIKISLPLLSLEPA